MWENLKKTKHRKKFAKSKCKNNKRIQANGQFVMIFAYV